MEAFMSQMEKKLLIQITLGGVKLYLPRCILAVALIRKPTEAGVYWDTEISDQTEIYHYKINNLDELCRTAIASVNSLGL